MNFDWDEMDIINTLKIREATERAIKTDSSGVKRVILSFDIEHIFNERAKAREEMQAANLEAFKSSMESDPLGLVITYEKDQLCCDSEAYPLTFGQRLRIWLRNLRNF